MVEVEERLRKAEVPNPKRGRAARKLDEDDQTKGPSVGASEEKPK